MKFRLFLVLFIASCSTFAQTKIVGTVIDEKTNQGISNASVYLNNSSCGTETDSLGRFTLSCPINGKAELVFSHVLYEKKVQLVDPAKAEELLIPLKLQPNTLKEVVIRSKKHSQADITRWINLFSVNLIGRYGHSSSLCKIKNTEVLYFDFDKGKNELTVYAQGPLLIENPHLGYSIRLDIDHFSFNFKTNEVVFTYSCRYDELKENKWFTPSEVKANRTTVYWGSALHFMRSVYKNTALQEGFEVFNYKSIQNKERARVQGIIASRLAEAYSNEVNPNVNYAYLFSKDSAAYYNKIMKQPSVFRFDTVRTTISKYLKKDRLTRTVNLNFPDTLMVTYQQPSPSVAVQLPEKNNANPVKKKEMPHKELTSFLYFFKDGGININNGGYYGELSLFMYGDMAERRLAYALPLDYEPIKQ